jgi:hypothetical protein
LHAAEKENYFSCLYRNLTVKINSSKVLRDNISIKNCACNSFKLSLINKDQNMIDVVIIFFNHIPCLVGNGALYSAERRSSNRIDISNFRLSITMIVNGIT